MSSHEAPSPDLAVSEDVAGPRAILRVPDVLIALGEAAGGASLAELATQLSVPKTSLHRLLRTLENGGFLVHADGRFRLGPASFRMATIISRAAPAASFPASARPVLEWLAQETGETVMLGVLASDDSEIIYVDVIDSRAPVRFSVPVGDRRPLYSAASGKAVLAYLSPDRLKAYLGRTRFTRFTPMTSVAADLPALLDEIRAEAVAFDLGGMVIGASAVASPIFAADGAIAGSVSVAGPTDRIEEGRDRLAALVREAAARIASAIGFSGPYPHPEKD
jgi:IclR family acetate operon transcriptional repressor